MDNHTARNLPDLIANAGTTNPQHRHSHRLSDRLLDALLNLSLNEAVDEILLAGIAFDLVEDFETVRELDGKAVFFQNSTNWERETLGILHLVSHGHISINIQIMDGIQYTYGVRADNAAAWTGFSCRPAFEHECTDALFSFGDTPTPDF